MTADQSINVVRDFFDAWNDKDWERWSNLHTDNAYHAGPDHVHPLQGRDTILAAHKGLGNVFPDFKYELTRILAQDNMVCAEWLLYGTQNGPLPGPGGRAEATGKSVHVPGCFVFRVEGDKVAEYVGHVDFLGMYTQLGLIDPLSSDVGRA